MPSLKGYDRFVISVHGIGTATHTRFLTGHAYHVNARNSDSVRLFNRDADLRRFRSFVYFENVLAHAGLINTLFGNMRTHDNAVRAVRLLLL